MALLILFEKITDALDNSDFAFCMLIDFREAFDTVDLKILLDKLNHYGSIENALRWFNCYLNN